MSDLWIPVIAALGASFLTGLSTFGLEWWRTARERKAALSDRRLRAYSLLLERAAIISFTAWGIHFTMEIRSGLREGVNVATRNWKPLEPLEFSDRLRAEMQPIYEALTEVWTIGSKEAIAEANDLVNRCGAVIGAASQPGEAGSKFQRFITGEKWTPEQLSRWGEELRGLAEARRRFAAIARREAGVEVADLFASNERQPAITPPAVPSHTAAPSDTPR